MVVSDIGATQRLVSWKGMKIALPKSFPLERLISIIVELDVSANPHYFFHPKISPPAATWVLDVGACEGLFSLLSQHRWPESPVMAIEPGPEMCTALQKTFELTHTAIRPTIESCLLGAAAGEAGFIEDAADPARSRVIASNEIALGEQQRMIAVKVHTIDGLFCSRNRSLGLIKMDAEGAELEILKGAEMCLKRDKPALAITTYHNPTDAANIREWLQGLGLDYEITVRGITCMDSLEPRPIMLFAIPRARIGNRLRDGSPKNGDVL